MVLHYIKRDTTERNEWNKRFTSFYRNEMVQNEAKHQVVNDMIVQAHCHVLLN